MPLKQGREVAARAPVPSTLQANTCYAIEGNYTIKTGDLANDVIELGGIPPNSDVVDFVLHHNGVGGTIDAGIMTGDYGVKNDARNVGSEFTAAAATATSGVVRMTKSATDIAASQSERGWGVKLLAAPTVGKVIRATLFVVPQGI